MTNSAALFPLPLTPFEYYYWCDDNPEYPTTFPVEMQFRGELRRESFEQALRVALSRHPLLNAVVDAGSGRIPRWIDQEGTAAPVEWSTAAPTSNVSADEAFLDLTLRPGLRVRVRVSPEESRVTVRFHHACCDALGGIQFIEDLLVAYDSQIHGTDVNTRMRSLAPDRLKQRADYGHSETNDRITLHDVLMTARIWAASLLPRAAFVTIPERMTAASAGHAPRESAWNGETTSYVTAVLSQVEFHRLHDVATTQGVTRNDLMLRDLFLVLRDWNNEHGDRGNRRIVVNVPVSLRTRLDREMPAANSLGFWFVRRTRADCRDPAALLDSIRPETAAVRKWRLPLYFVGGLDIAARVPGLMRGMLRAKKSFATAVFSNVGRVFARTPLERRDGRLVCGDTVLERITGVPPIRPGTRVAIAVATYGEETTINLHYDRRFLTARVAGELLERFRERLLVSARTHGV